MTLAEQIRDALWTRIPAAMRYAEPAQLLAIVQEVIEADAVARAPERLAKEAKQIPPTLAQVEAMLKKIGSDLDPRDFIEFYAARGWMVGKVPMKDWHAALHRADRLWDRPDRRSAGSTTPRLSEWERSKKEERVKELRSRLRDLTHPGGCAYAVDLTGERRADAQAILDRITAIQRELNQ